MSADDYLPLVYRLPSDVHVDSSGVGSLSWEPGQGPFEQRAALEPNAGISSVHWQPGALTADECAVAAALGRGRPPLDGRVELGADTYRVGHIAWIEPEPANHWLFHKVGVLFAQANRRYGFELVGLVDALQYTEYGPGQHFDWHMDIGREQTSLRKLSATIQLSAADEYDGGALEFVGLAAMPESRTQGSATFFPSFMGHRITPVTRGLRRSLVAWAAGVPFR
ncbi:MAG TPA: 2OG-Fe(II) oxygenase [Ramlibacter sp.]|nr:2OG-Fe(II) oxygenase [Ramlibacter sp.]